MRFAHGVSTELKELIETGWEDPWTGHWVQSPVARLVVGRRVTAEIDHLLPQTKQPTLVADENTWAAAGVAVAAALAPLQPERIVLREPKATTETVASLAPRLEAADLAVAVGSGVVNDVVKAAAARVDIPYAAVATAASMNGYVTGTASLLDDQLKVSSPAAPPLAVIVDLDVLHAAPQRLTRAGIGDALCRTTVQTDAWLAARLRNAPYSSAVFDLQRNTEDAVLAEPAAVLASAEALRPLVDLLLLGGFAMLIWGSSAAASQGEHLISHALEMDAESSPSALHGEQIGVTTLALADLQDRLFHGQAPVLVGSGPDWFGRADHILGQRDVTAAALMAKSLSDDDAQGLTTSLRTRWRELQSERRGWSVPAPRLHAALTAAGCPTAPGDLGIRNAVFRRAVLAAPAIRDRWGTLDLIAHCKEQMSLQL